MEPLLRMDNVGSFLFPPGHDASGEADLARASEQLGDELVVRLEAVSGRRPGESKLAEARAKLGEARRSGRPLGDGTTASLPVEQDKTWFIRKWDDDQAAEAIRWRLERRAERHRRWLLGQVLLTLDAQRSASPADLDLETSSDVPEEDADNAAQADKSPRGLEARPLGTMTLGGWISPRLGVAARNRPSLLEVVIREVRDRQERRMFLRELSLQVKMRRRLAEDEGSTTHLATKPTVISPVRTAGGKTSRYVPLD